MERASRLTADAMRAATGIRFAKKSRSRPASIERYEFASFSYFSRRLEKGSRLRLVFSSPNSIYPEKNYNSGGEVAAESRKDARTAHVTLYQGAERASYLEVPAVPPSASLPRPFDVFVRGGTIYDGTGQPPRRADLAIKGDRIAAVGDLSRATAKEVVDAKGLAVSPGFINMLSWSTDSLLARRPSGQSEVRQGDHDAGIMGEGNSWGPRSNPGY